MSYQFYLYYNGSSTASISGTLTNGSDNLFLLPDHSWQVGINNNPVMVNATSTKNVITLEYGSNYPCESGVMMDDFTTDITFNKSESTTNVTSSINCNDYQSSNPNIADPNIIINYYNNTYYIIVKAVDCPAEYTLQNSICYPNSTYLCYGRQYNLATCNFSKFPVDSTCCAADGPNGLPQIKT
jgi:hypothetical protein